MNNPDTLRQRAEALANARAGVVPETLAGQSAEQIRQTLHELRVHQIELEMQNEELRQTQVELDATRARYFDLYDLAPVGYCTVDAQGLIEEANLTVTKLLGVARNKLIMQPFSKLILPEDQDLYYRQRQQLLQTGSPQNCDLRLTKSDGSLFWANLVVTAALSANGEASCRVVLNEITDRKRMEDVQHFLAQTSVGTPDEPFFKVVARYLAHAMGMDFVCIDRLKGDGLMAQTVAVWCDGKFEDNVTYALKDTPCATVVGQAICCYPASVCQFFPRDQVLQELRAESYLGVTLWDYRGQPIGLIAVIGRKPLANRPLAEAMLTLVGTRTAGELERQQADAVLHKKYEETEHFNQLMTGRELRMIELKEEINALLIAAGQAAKYRIVTN